MINKTRPLLSQIFKGFNGRAGTLLLGSVLGQGIGLFMLPLITRLYTPAVIGQTATVLAIVSVSALWVCFQYDLAIVVADERDLSYLFLLCSMLILAWGAITGFFIWIDRFITLENGQHILEVWSIDWTLPVLVMTNALIIVLINIHLRGNHVLRVSGGRIIYYGGATVFPVLFGIIFTPDQKIYLFSQIITYLLCILFLIPYDDVYSWIKKDFLHFAVVTGLQRVARMYEKFPKYQMGAGIFNALSVYLPILFLRIAFSDVWAGYYFLAYRILAGPTTLLAQAVGQVYYRDAAERERSGLAQAQILERVVYRLIRISLLPSVLVGILAPILVEAFLGPGWAPVAKIIQILLVSLVVVFFTSPISTLLNVKGRQAGALGYNALLFAGRSFSMLVGWLLQSPLGMVWAYSIATLVIMLMFFRYVVHSVSGSVRSIVIKALPVLRDGGLVLGMAVILYWVGILYRPASLLLVCGVGLILFWREFYGRGQRLNPISGIE